MVTHTVEIWKSVPSFPGIEASSLGRIRRVGSTTTLQGSPATKGRYLVVDLGDAGTQYVHRLVAEAHLGSIKGMVVHHLFSPQDNRAVAIEIVTHAENARRASEVDLTLHTIKGERNPDQWGRGSLNQVQVLACRMALASGKRGALSAVAANYGVSYSVAYSAASGRGYTYYGATSLETEINRQTALAERAARKATAQVARAKAARSANPYGRKTK